MNGAGLDLGTVTIVVAIGAGLTFLALCVVFGGFFAERRLRDRLEDIETRALTGSRSPSRGNRSRTSASVRSMACPSRRR
jgi:tight adherence protein B